MQAQEAGTEDTLRHWRDHLPPGITMDPVELMASGTLPRAWADRWRAAPDALLWKAPFGPGGGPGDSSQSPAGRMAQGRWWTAGEFESATRHVAGRLRGAGLGPGDRVLWSVASSIPALVAHVAALRAGLVVVPANVAYSERELAHIVLDARPVAAIVDRTEQADWV